MGHAPHSPFPPNMTPPQGISLAAWAKPIAILLLGWAMSGLVGYFHTDLAISSRLTAVETHQQDTTSRLDRIENKLDQALQAIASK